MMKDGIYSINFEFSNRLGGYVSLFFHNEKIVGSGYSGIKYDGTYIYNPKTQNIEAKVKIIIPPGGTLIHGITPKGNGQKMEFEINFPNETPKTPFSFMTDLGVIKAEICHERSF